MENATHALYMAAAFLVFIGAFSYSLYMVNKLNTTANMLVYRLDETNYYDSLDLTELIADSDNTTNSYKIVSIDSIIPVLYKYYRESYTVRILDTNGELLQLFDTTVEGEVMTATNLLSSRRTDRQKALLSLYGDSDKACYMFGAPWLGSTNKDTKERIDMYISGDSGYINNTWVDYSENYLRQYEDRQFQEIFSEYTYEGDTITSEDGEETLTGTRQTSAKIVITYQLLP